jgi:hypothetical protein
MRTVRTPVSDIARGVDAAGRGRAIARRRAHGYRCARPARQRGRLLLAAATATLWVATGALVAWSGAQSQSAALALDREQREWLEAARHQLERWYLRELATVDAQPDGPDARALLAAAGIAPRWGARLVVGERVTLGEAAGRELRLSIPVDAGATSPDAPQVRVSGLALQAAAVARARAGLERLARDFELGHRVRHHADPARDVSVNRYRAQDCLRPRALELPCVETWTDLSTLDLPEAADAQSRLDPWGGVVQMRNDLPAGSEPVHRLRLRVLTPWGSVLEVTALPAS